MNRSTPGTISVVLFHVLFHVLFQEIHVLALETVPLVLVLHLHVHLVLLYLFQAHVRLPWVFYMSNPRFNNSTSSSTPMCSRFCPLKSFFR